MKWYEEGIGTFHCGKYVICEYDKTVQEWGHAIQGDKSKFLDFIKVCPDAQMFEDVMTAQVITPVMFFQLRQQ